MRIGIDFGTSYSAAAALVDGTLQLVRFGEDEQFRTTVYFPLRIPDVRRFELTAGLEREVDLLAAQALADQRASMERAQALRAAAMREPAARRADALAMVPTPTERTPDQLRQSAISAVRRQWMTEQSRLAGEAGGLDLQNALYGEEATDAYLESGTGHLVVSPKSMLGYRLSGAARDTLLGITSHILRHIRTTASNQLDVDIRAALLGRPVRFRSSMAEAGSVQAQQILTDAAHAAGFDSVEFLEEPAAAAVGLHSQLERPTRALVIDIGGGTTDLALATVGGGGARAAILGAWGEPIGGADVDIDLSMGAVMGLFGKDVTRIPVHRFYEASAVQDIQRQANFRRCSFADFDAPYSTRLAELQASGQTVRLNRAVENAKIALSTQTGCVMPLDYIEPGLAAAIERTHLHQASRLFLSQLKALVRTALGEMDGPPELVYLTGGMSRSPSVHALVEAELPGIPVLAGNASLGVVSGLASAAQRDGTA